MSSNDWEQRKLGDLVDRVTRKNQDLAFWPFGKEVVYGNGTFSFLVNLIWILFFGWGMALGNIVLGCMWCITIVGIPFGKQFFKMARLSFMPFGANVL